MTHAPLPAALLEALQELLSDRLSTAKAVCQHHGRDESVLPEMPPQAVVYPRSTDEVAAIVRLCAAHGVPLIPYGAGSSLEGNTLAPHGGVTVNLQQMNQVLSIAAEDATATVQAGVTRLALNAVLRDSGLFFPVDPGADATLGGMAATRASGTNAVRYGTMRENVLSLSVVLANGQVIRTAQRARKSAAGYDLTRLFVGSEGTLGIITEVTLRLHPQPESVSAAVCCFDALGPAFASVIQIIQLGVPVARCEFVDALAIRAINAHSHTSLPERAHLFFEFHGDPAGVAAQAALVQEITGEAGGSRFEWASRPEDRTRLWSARHNAYFAVLQLRPGSRSVVTDVCVPISRLADCVEQTQRDLEASGAIAAVVGHVGDGNFHVQILVDPEQPEQLARAEALNRRIVERAIAMDGTCTGEHGIGLHKRDYLRDELGDAVDVMRMVKQALDPGQLMNPGKVFAKA